jgi:hypothetical protein
MTHDAQQVMAYVDGELDAAARAEFERALAGDASLQAAVERERALRAALAAAYDPVLDEPLPASLEAALRADTAVVDLAAARRAKQQRTTAPRRWHWPEWGATAACLVLGVALGLGGASFVPGGSDDVIVRRADGVLVARGALDRVLTESLAADGGASPGLAVGLSFKARDGRYCRSFVTGAVTASAGLACRDGGVWQLQVLAPAETASTAPGAYRQAAAALSPALLESIEKLRDGEMLDAAGERAARTRGWQR